MPLRHNTLHILVIMLLGDVPTLPLSPWERMSRKLAHRLFMAVRIAPQSPSERMLPVLAAGLSMVARQ